MQGKEIEKLTKIIAKLPALGTRSARRIVLQLLKKKETDAGNAGVMLYTIKSEILP